MPPGSDKDTSRRAQRLAEFERAYADAVLDGDPAAAERVVADAIDAGFDAATIDDHVIRPVMRMVGDLWEQGDLGIDQEHLATEISLRVLALQREAFRVAHRRARHRVLLAAVEGETHVLGLQMAGDALVRAGYDVRLLGPDVPAHAFAAAVRRHRPTVIGLTVTMPAMLDAARKVDAGVSVLVGGAAAPERLRRGPPLTVCEHVADVVAIVDTLVQRPQAN